MTWQCLRLLWLPVAITIVMVPAATAMAAQGHLVDPTTRDERLSAQGTSRLGDAAALSAFLAAPAAIAAAKRIGVDGHELSGRVWSLNDRELHDLAFRADALGPDPVAGMGAGGWILLVILVVAVVWLLGGGGCVAGC